MLLESRHQKADPLDADFHAADLYLACACLRGDERALAQFEEHFLSSLTGQLARRRALRDFDDEAMQLLRVRLLVRDGESPPRLAGYQGKGPLRVWLFTAATRLALNLKRSGSPPQADTSVDELGAAGADPEMRYLKARYGAQVEEALCLALEALPQREANLLGLHFLEGLPSVAIARMYGVTRRAVHKWLLQARERVMNDVRTTLAGRLGLSPSELDSVIALAHSQIDVTLRRHLGRKSGSGS